MSPDPSRYRGAPVPSAGNTERGKGSEQREKKENQRDFVALHNSLQCGAVCPPKFQAIGQEETASTCSRLDIWERFSTKRVAKPWRGLVVESSSLQVFKNHLNVALQQQSYPKVPTHSSDHLILWHDTYRKTNSIAKGSSSF